MSGKYPVVSWRELEKLLEQHGYRLVSQHGSHMKYRHPSGSVAVAPRHKELTIGVLKTVLKELSRTSGLSVDQLIEELKRV